MQSDYYEELERTAGRLRDKASFEQSEIDHWAEVWRPRLAPGDQEEELLDVCNAEGRPVGVVAPRWFCHLFGLRHRVTHIILRSPQNLLALQIRSSEKADWPNHVDTSVGGHVRAGQTFLEGGVAEMEQELGLPADDLQSWLVGGELTKVGDPYIREDHRPGPPLFRNHQINQLFAGRLTPAGLARIRFRDGEVSALYLCTVAEAKRLLTERDRTAPGLVHSLPRYFEHIELVDSGRALPTGRDAR